MGDSNVGLSSFLALVDDGFPDPKITRRSICVRKKKVTLLIINTRKAPGGRFGFGVANYCFCEVVVIMYDITNQDSFKRVVDWIRGAPQAMAGVRKILIGNKSDKETKRAVETHKAKDFADEFGIPFLEISCKCSWNINEAITMIGCSVADFMDHQPEIRTNPVSVPPIKKRNDKCLLS